MDAAGDERAETDPAQRLLDGRVGRRRVEQRRRSRGSCPRTARPPGARGRHGDAARPSGCRRSARRRATPCRSSPRRGAAAGGRTSSCRCRCGRRHRPTCRRRCRGRCRAGSTARRRRRRTTRRGRRCPARRAAAASCRDRRCPARTSSRSMTRTIAPFAFCTVSSWWTSSSSGRSMSSTYWNSRNAVPTVIAPLATSAAPTTRASTEPAVMAPCTAHHMRMNARWRRIELCRAPELSSTNRHMACTPAPLARRSSAAVRRSSMPPYRRALRAISSDDSLIARWRIASSTATAPARYSAMPTPSRQSSTVSTTRMPAISSAPPTALGTTWPRKSDTDVTSPSTRWISSPGVWRRWNSWSRPSTWRVMRRRSSFVVPHAVIVAKRMTTTAMTCVATAMARNSEGEAHERRRVGAVGGLVDDPPHDERTGQRQRRADAQERAEGGPTLGVGPQEGDQGAPARRGRFRHGSIVPPRPSGCRVGFDTLGAWKPTPRRWSPTT